jgi:hypothetical protein
MSCTQIPTQPAAGRPRATVRWEANLGGDVRSVHADAAGGRTRQGRGAAVGAAGGQGCRRVQWLPPWPHISRCCSCRWPCGGRSVRSSGWVGRRSSSALPGRRCRRPRVGWTVRAQVHPWFGAYHRHDQENPPMPQRKRGHGMRRPGSDSPRDRAHQKRTQRQRERALGDKVNPGSIARRQVGRVRGSATAVRDSVMGTAADADDTGQHAATTVGDAVSRHRRWWPMGPRARPSRPA